MLVNGKKYFKFKADSCNLMREANIWITSYCLIISRGNSSGSSFLSTRYQFAFSGISIFWFRKIPLGLLRFPIKKTKTLRNHQTFHDVASWKEFEAMCIYQAMWCGCEDWGSRRLCKHGKIFICFQKKCYKKVITSCLFFIIWFMQYLIW